MLYVNVYLSLLPILCQYDGDPVSLAISEAVLCVVEEENLAEHAKELGSYIRTRLMEMAQKHPCIGDVRYVDTVHGQCLVIHVHNVDMQIHVDVYTLHWLIPFLPLPLPFIPLPLPLLLSLPPPFPFFLPLPLSLSLSLPTPEGMAYSLVLN